MGVSCWHAHKHLTPLAAAVDHLGTIGGVESNDKDVYDVPGMHESS